MFITRVLFRADIAWVGVISPMILMGYPATVNNALPLKWESSSCKKHEQEHREITNDQNFSC